MSSLRNILRSNYSFYALCILLLAVITLNILHVVHLNKLIPYKTIKFTSAKVSNPIINFGKKQLGSPIEAPFTIANLGPNPLLIEDVYVDCHCTTPHYSDHPVLPGDSTVILVTYDSTLPGFFQKKVLVKVNTSDSPILLVFRGELY